MKTMLALASAFALSATLGVAGAQAGGSSYHKPAGHYTANNGKSHINQNGNGCRNRCYGADQTFNAGYNNGNTYGGGSGSGHYTANNGKSHINQNGNGCRNRCYGGDQTFNAGYNNGNTYGKKGH